MKAIENEYEEAFAAFWKKHVAKIDPREFAGFLPWDAYGACNALYWSAHDQNGRGKSWSYHKDEEDPEKEFLAHESAYKGAWRLMKMRRAVSRLRTTSLETQKEILARAIEML